MRISKIDWFFSVLILITVVIAIATSACGSDTPNGDTNLEVTATDATTIPTEPITELIVESISESVIEVVETAETTESVETVETTPPVEIHEPVFKLSEYERSVVESMVMGEAGGESYEGQLLVAQCILNGSLKEGIQPSELRIRYQYSGWNTNVSDSVRNAVSEVFDYGYKVTEEEVLYFYNPNMVYSRWHESMRYVLTEGHHKFFADWS